MSNSDPIDEELAAMMAALAAAQPAFEQIVIAVEPILRSFPRDPDLVAAVKPEPDDYAQVFAASVADKVAKAYDEMWRSHPPRIEAAEEQVAIDIYAAPSQMFATDNVLSRRFPEGYRSLAPYLVADLVWLRWRYRELDETSGMVYDGLVYVGDRWRWFPKPYRVVGPIVMGGEN